MELSNESSNESSEQKQMNDEMFKKLIDFYINCRLKLFDADCDYALKSIFCNGRFHKIASITVERKTEPFLGQKSEFVLKCVRKNYANAIEGYILSNLRHENLCESFYKTKFTENELAKFYLEEPMENYYFYEMEYYRKGTLYKHLHLLKAPMSEFMAYWYGRQIKSALDYLHKNGILHRSVRLNSVFLVDDYRVKLGEFTFATTLQAAQCGKPWPKSRPRIAPPELLSGQPHGTSCDVWGFGAIMYELVTQRSHTSNDFCTWPDGVRLSGGFCNMVEAALQDDPYTREPQFVQAESQYRMQVTNSVSDNQCSAYRPKC